MFEKILSVMVAAVTVVFLLLIITVFIAIIVGIIKLIVDLWR